MNATQLSPYAGGSSDSRPPLSTNMNTNANAYPNAPNGAPATLYYVFSADNNHVGPVSAELIGRGVVAGKVPNDAFVSLVGSNQWIPLSSVPELNLAVNVAQVSHSSNHSSVRPASMPGTVVLTGPPPPPVPQDLGNFIPPPAPALAIVASPLAVLEVPPPPPTATAKAEEKKEEKKPVLDPRFKLLPLAIFGGFAFIGAIETAIALLVMK